MKIHEFGLWFNPYYSDGWLATMPPQGSFDIYYDGQYLGCQYGDLDLEIYTFNRFILKLKNDFAVSGNYYKIGRRLTLDDFEVIPNPNYKEIP